MTPLERIFEAARAVPRHIILPEGEDARVQSAAERAVQEGLARVTLLAPKGSPAPQGVTLIDPQTCADFDAIADCYHRLRAHKGVSAEDARTAAKNPLIQAAVRVRLGLADGTVGGAVASTADTVRTALQVIGRKPGITTVSSFFLMLSDAPQTPFEGGAIFSDCGLVIEPDAAALADIARASAQNCRALLGQEPCVALLSFSTAGSAQHKSLDTIRDALDLVRRAEPDLIIDGEIQFDAALDPHIRAKKAPHSTLTRTPNVFIFPNLAAGNIGYKIAQRLGGLTAVGPILQGLNLPANDLSRGSSVDDIVAAIAVTAAQCESAPA